jgi:hypothetical protein
VQQANYTAQNVWTANQFVMRVLRKGNSNTECLSYMSLVRSVVDYVAICWDTCREWLINALDQVQQRAAQFTVQEKAAQFTAQQKAAQFTVQQKAAQFTVE